ncbi:MAG: HDOD domain-containing protein [Candidatus Zixiibacteriota bacterium]
MRSKILGVRELYTLPQTLVEVLRVTDSPQTSAHDLSRIILRDAPITARLLRMANSVMYGQQGRVNTVHQAVVLLGFRAVKSLVLSTAVYDLFADRNENPPFDFNQFWQYSLETAGISQLLAGRIGYQPQEEAFVAGLLHDIGLLVMARACPEEYRQFLAGADAAKGWCEAEGEFFGIDHAEAGAALFRDWGLPQPLIDAVARHHEYPLQVSGPNADRLTLLVALSDRVAHQGIWPRATLTRAMVEEKHRIVSTLGLRPLDLSLVDRWVSENLTAIASHLDIEVGSPTEILARANQRLYELHQETEALLLESAGTSRDELTSEILEAVCATFSHYINNASTSIMGHAELVQMAIARGVLADPDGRLADSMRMVEDAVVSISAVLTEMKQLTRFDVVSYHDRAQILNIEDKVKRRVETLRPRI